MRKKIFLTITLILAILCISKTCLGFNLNINLDKTKNIKANDEITLILKSNEPFIGASFKLNINENLELIESETNNLSVSENDNKIACVYVDMGKTGTDTLKIKFKTKNNITSNLEFSLEETKFITAENEIVYNQDEIIGIEKTIEIQNDSNLSNSENKTENTIQNENKNTTLNSPNNNKTNITATNNNITSNNKTTTQIKTDSSKSENIIPYTGANSTILIIAIAITLISTIYFGIKLKK